MTAIDPTSSNVTTLDQSAAQTPTPSNDAPSNRLDGLLALAQNPNATPVARGQALAEADALTGGRAETLLAQADAQIASASTRGASARLDTQVTGPNLWQSRIQSTQLQLRYESRLNTQANPSYARDLNQLANNIQYGATTLPQGTYRTASPPQIVGTTRGNPLEIDKIAAASSQQNITRLTNQIDSINAEIGRLTAINANLRQQIQSGGLNSLQRVQAEGSLRTNQANILRLQGENALNLADRNKAINDARLQTSRTENGGMYRAVANNADSARPPVIFINGVNTDISRSAMQAMELSQRFRAPVDHVVNVSSMDKMGRIGLGVLSEAGVRSALVSVVTRSVYLPDQNVLDQRLQQVMSGNPPAAATAANAILDQLQNTTGPVKIIGYSQGAAIGNEALRMVNDILRAQGVSQAERTQMLGRVEFLGIGPAAGERHIARTYDNGRLRDIPELRAVDYRTVSDANDPIARALNVSNPDGSSTSRADLERSRSGIEQAILGNNGGIGPHLSYFFSYTQTDPGSRYDSRAGALLDRWYAGMDVPTNAIPGVNFNPDRPSAGGR